MAVSRSAVGRRVRRWRERENLTLIDVAAKIGISESLLCRYELGQRALPLGSVGPLSSLCGIPVGDLMSAKQRRDYLSLAVRADVA